MASRTRRFLFSLLLFFVVCGFLGTVVSQKLGAQSSTDESALRDDLRSYALEQLGRESAILVIDETSFPKQGKKSAGVGVQYCGTTGLVENCQVAVFLDYVSALGHAFIDRELYLPKSWIDDQQRWDLQIDYHGFLFAAIGLQLALVVAEAESLYSCSGCGVPYIRAREKKRPKS